MALPEPANARPTWILYAGLGTIGFDRHVYTDFKSYIPDTGVGSSRR